MHLDILYKTVPFLDKNKINDNLTQYIENKKLRQQEQEKSNNDSKRDKQKRGPKARNGEDKDSKYITPNKSHNQAPNPSNPKEGSSLSTEPFKNQTPVSQKKKDSVTLKKPWTDIRNEDSERKHLFDSKTPKKASALHNLRSGTKNRDRSADEDEIEDPQDAFKTPKKWSRMKTKGGGKELEN
jgi:hypothetical protein